LIRLFSLYKELFLLFFSHGQKLRSELLTLLPNKFI
jgi:hypothetical protein